MSVIATIRKTFIRRFDASYQLPAELSVIQDKVTGETMAACSHPEDTSHDLPRGVLFRKIDDPAFEASSIGFLPRDRNLHDPSRVFRAFAPYTEQVNKDADRCIVAGSFRRPGIHP
ncbi:MAG: hypothetical protein R3D69_06990 [Xanthobacteraceae bacterium]